MRGREGGGKSKQTGMEAAKGEVGGEGTGMGEATDVKRPGRAKMEAPR